MNATKILASTVANTTFEDFLKKLSLRSIESITVDDVVQEAYEIMRAKQEIKFRSGRPFYTTRVRDMTKEGLVQIAGGAIGYASGYSLISPFITKAIKFLRSPSNKRFTRIFYEFFGFPSKDAALLEERFSDNFETEMLTAAIVANIKKIEDTRGFLPELNTDEKTALLREVKKDGKIFVNRRLRELCDVIKYKGRR